MKAIALILMAISLDLKDASLVDALKQVEQESGLQLAYAQELVENAKPVTLKVENVPAGEVLRLILRPRGLEFIQTSDTMAAIVPAASDMGMAKMFGRALRTFARLEKKLEAAEQHGDEVRVPGWTDADDRALAGAAIDVFSAAFYFDMNRNWNAKDWDAWIAAAKRMISAYDPDVRASVVLRVIRVPNMGLRKPEGLRLWPRSYDIEEWIHKMGSEMLTDGDHIVRACGLFLRAAYSDKRKSHLESAVAAGANDPAPAVRLAAAHLCALLRRPERPESAAPPVLEALRADDNAAVRFVAWSSWANRRWTPVTPTELRALGEGLLTDKNPIVRALGLFSICRTGRKDPAKMEHALEMVDLEKDPWLKRSVDALLPLLEGRSTDSSVDMGSLLLSGSRSHQALGTGALYMALSRLVRQAPRLDLDAIAGLSSSGYLWPRLAGILANGTLQRKDAEARLLEALKSDDEAGRIAALLGLFFYGPQRKQELPGRLLGVVRTSLRAPTFAESALSSFVVCLVLPFDECVAIFQEQAKRNPEAASTRALLVAAMKHRDVEIERRGVETDDRELWTQGQMILLDAVLGSKNEALQNFFHQTAPWWLKHNRPLLLTMICDSEPEAFCGLLMNHGFRQNSFLKEFECKAIADRLRSIGTSDDPAARVLAAKTMGAFIVDNRAFFRVDRRALFGGREVMMNSLGVIGAMLDRCFGEAATDSEIAAGLMLLEGVLGPRGPLDEQLISWPDMPRAAHGVVLRALGYANHKTHGPRAAAVLGSLYRQWDRAGIQDDGALGQAMGTARRAIMEKGYPEDQAVVLCGMATLEDEGVAGPAVAELEKVFMAGALLPDIEVRALRSFMEHPMIVSPGFERYIMSRLGNEYERSRLRTEALTLLGLCSDQFGQLIDTLTEVAGEEESRFKRQLPYVLARAVRRNLAALEDSGQPAPPWADKAADLGMMLASPDQPLEQRVSSLPLYVAAAGAKAADVIEALVLDEDTDPRLRAVAASELPAASPRTKLYATLAERYEGLPRELRKALAPCAVQALQAPGAEAFVVRSLRDNDLRPELERLLESWKLPPLSAELKAALRELGNDPGWVSFLAHKILRIERLQREQEEKN